MHGEDLMVVQRAVKREAAPGGRISEALCLRLIKVTGAGAIE